MGRLSLVTLAACLAGHTASASPTQDYMLYCMGCHGPEAQGVPGNMRTPEGRNYVLRVPGAANSVLSDAQLAAVLNWLAATYVLPGEAQPPPFSAEEVARIRHIPLANVLATRREVVQALSASGPAPAPEY
jgi:hypothetical protein